MSKPEPRFNVDPETGEMVEIDEELSAATSPLDATKEGSVFPQPPGLRCECCFKRAARSSGEALLNEACGPERSAVDAFERLARRCPSRFAGLPGIARFKPQRLRESARIHAWMGDPEGHAITVRCGHDAL